MNIPTFTAEASLYKTSGYYQTGRHMLNLCKQANSTIYPAMMSEGPYTSNGCGVGGLLWGLDSGGVEGVEWGCDYPWLGMGDGDGGGGDPVVVPEDGPHGGGGGADPMSELRLPPGLEVCKTADYIDHTEALKICNRLVGAPKPRLAGRDSANSARKALILLLF
jgi:hypothetical protein